MQPEFNNASNDRPSEAQEKPVERPTGDRPRIYVASLLDYNYGVLHGVWVEADQEGPTCGPR